MANLNIKTISQMSHEKLMFYKGQLHKIYNSVTVIGACEIFLFEKEMQIKTTSEEIAH